MRHDREEDKYQRKLYYSRKGAEPGDTPSDRWLVRPKRRLSRSSSVVPSQLSPPNKRLKRSFSVGASPRADLSAPFMQRESYVASSPGASPRPVNLTLPSFKRRSNETLRTCATCGVNESQPGVVFGLCTRCNLGPYYCSVKCENANWKVHQFVCDNILEQKRRWVIPMVEDEPELSSSGDSEPERSSSDEPDQIMPDEPNHNFQDEPGHINQDDAPGCAVCSAEENLVPYSGCENIHYCSTECAQLDYDFHRGNCNRPGLVKIADPLTGGKHPICANCSRKKSKEGLPLLHCGRCCKMHYCGDACAEKHWPWHSLTCKAAGKEPVVYSSSSQGPANDTAPRRQKIVECANCSDGQSVGGGPLGYCTICGLVRYCSAECEQADREWHSLTCRRKEDIASESKSGGPTYLDNTIDINFSGGPKIRLAPKKKAIKSTRPLVSSEHVNQKAAELNKLIEEGGRLFFGDDFAGSRTPSSPTTTASSESSPNRKPRDRSRTPPQSRPPAASRSPPPQNLPPRLSPEPSLVRILAHQPTPPHFRTLSFLTNLQPDHWTDGAALLPFSVYNPALHAY